MFGFDFKKNIFLGIDIGTSAIKIVELKASGGKPMLSNYAWAPLKGFSRKNYASQAYFDTVLSKYLNRMFKEGKFRGRQTYVSIPAFGGLVTLIDFPKMARSDMEQAIRFEAHKYIPTSLDEVVISWDVIDGLAPGTTSENTDGKEFPVFGSGNPSSGEKVNVLLVAASKNRVVRYEKLIRDAGLELKSIELESFSMVTSLVGNDGGTFVIIDIGSRICNIIIVEKGIIRATRNIDAGGGDVTRTIAKSMEIDEARAEKLKMSSKDFFGKESYISFPALESIAAETSRMINSIYKDQPQKKVDAAILSGGTAKLTGVQDYFSRALDLKIVEGNPFGRIGYDKSMEPIIERMGARFSVAVGLALKGFDNLTK